MSHTGSIDWDGDLAPARSHRVHTPPRHSSRAWRPGWSPSLSGLFIPGARYKPYCGSTPFGLRC